MRLRSRTVTHLEPWVLTRTMRYRFLENHLGTRELAGFGLEGHPAAAVAAGSIVHYLRATNWASWNTSTGFDITNTAGACNSMQ